MTLWRALPRRGIGAALVSLIQFFSSQRSAAEGRTDPTPPLRLGLTVGRPGISGILPGFALVLLINIHGLT